MIIVNSWSAYYKPIISWNHHQITIQSLWIPWNDHLNTYHHHLGHFPLSYVESIDHLLSSTIIYWIFSYHPMNIIIYYHSYISYIHHHESLWITIKSLWITISTIISWKLCQIHRSSTIIYWILSYNPNQITYSISYIHHHESLWITIKSPNIMF